MPSCTRAKAAAQCPLIFGQASNVLDRACRRYDDELTVFLFGPRRQASGERVVVAACSPAQEGCPQVGVIVRDAKARREHDDRCGGDHQQQETQ
jgi:hypothetical protein